MSHLFSVRRGVEENKVKQIVIMFCTSTDFSCIVNGRHTNVRSVDDVCISMLAAAEPCAVCSPTALCDAPVLSFLQVNPLAARVGHLDHALI